MKTSPKKRYKGILSNDRTSHPKYAGNGAKNQELEGSYLNHHLAPSFSFFQGLQTHSQRAHYTQKGLGLRTKEAGNEANTWELRCLNRVQNPKIRVSSWAANSPSWDSSTRRVSTWNSGPKQLQHVELGLPTRWVLQEKCNTWIKIIAENKALQTSKSL